MRRALAAILIVVLALAVVVPPAEACLECVALGLASFAVFTQLVTALTVPRVVYPAPGYYAPPYYYPPPYYAPYGGAYPAVPPPVASYASAPAPGPYYSTPSVARPAPAGWTGPRVIQYAHGRHELRGDGVTVPYAWVWIPNARVPVVPSQTGPEDLVASRTP